MASASTLRRSPRHAGGTPSSLRLGLVVVADGYVDKAAEPEAFLDGIRDAADGRVVLTGLPSDYLGPIAEGIELHGDEPPLTEREREVLSVAAEGLTARQIGVRLGLAERTVTTHLAHIYGKLGVGGRVEAIAEGARAGLVTVEWVGDDARRLMPAGAG